MESSSKPETVPPGLGRMPVMSGPLLSDPLEKMHSQTDSVLTAARLARRGWTEDRNKTGWQFSSFDISARQPSVSRSEGNQGPKHAEICLKDPRIRQVTIVNNSKKTAEDREGTGSDKKADEAKQTERTFSANRQTERQTIVYSQAIIRVRVTGCRTTCRQFRRFKAPILPVIAEI